MKQKQPFFSIIIPTYNRPQQLANCLKALSRIDYPRDCFEVIVVDDGSMTPLNGVVVPMLRYLNLTLLTQPNSGAAIARNTGAKQAKGEFLVFTDDDCLPDSQWLQAFANHLAKTTDTLVGGKTVNALSQNPYSTASQMLLDYVYSSYNSNPPEARFFTSNNIAISAIEFHRIGGFASNFNIASEDREFCQRWLEHGYKMIYAPTALISHTHHLTFFSFWQQHFNYGRGAFCFYQTISTSKSNKQAIQPLSYYLNLLFYPFSQKSALSALLLTVLFLESQIATTTGLLWQWHLQQK
jgi:GT2 family glycosyltransferase